jgi:hypothetical protein
MGLFSKKDDSNKSQQSEYNKALEEEYYTKRGYQIYENDEGKWHKIERRLKEIEHERKGRK